MEVEKLLLGRTYNGFTGRVGAGEEAGFHGRAVNVPSTIGGDAPLPFAVVSDSHWNHCLHTCTAN